jgi:hypothetical protein
MRLTIVARERDRNRRVPHPLEAIDLTERKSTRDSTALKLCRVASR